MLHEYGWRIVTCGRFMGPATRVSVRMAVRLPASGPFVMVTTETPPHVVGPYPPPCASTAEVTKNDGQTGDPCSDKAVLTRDAQTSSAQELRPCCAIFAAKHIRPHRSGLQSQAEWYHDPAPLSLTTGTHTCHLLFWPQKLWSEKQYKTPKAKSHQSTRDPGRDRRFSAQHRTKERFCENEQSNLHCPNSVASISIENSGKSNLSWDLSKNEGKQNRTRLDTHLSVVDDFSLLDALKSFTKVDMSMFPSVDLPVRLVLVCSAG